MKIHKMFGILQPINFHIMGLDYTGMLNRKLEKKKTDTQLLKSHGQKLWDISIDGSIPTHFERFHTYVYVLTSFS